MNKALIAGVCGAAAIVVAAAQQPREYDRPRPGSRLAAALDADRDGVISAAEIRTASTALERLDVDADGRVGTEEMRPAFGPGGPRGGGPGRGGAELETRGGASAASADELTETLMAFDRNGDGRLDRAEVPERFQGLFDRADADKDGGLTREELKQSATASTQAEGGGGRRGREGGGFGRGRGGMADPLLRVLDTDHDGALSPSELAGASAALATLDANGDGQLSSEEFRGAARGGREGHQRRPL